MNVNRVRILPGWAQTMKYVDGEKRSYTGAFSFFVEAGKKHYEVELLMPGELNNIQSAVATMQTDRWHKRDYLLEITKLDEDDPQYKEQQVTIEEAGDLQIVLKQLNEGSIKAENQYRQEIPAIYASEVAGFLEPRVVLGVQSYVEGNTIIKKDILEQKLEQLRESERRDIPGMPIA